MLKLAVIMLLLIISPLSKADEEAWDMLYICDAQTNYVSVKSNYSEDETRQSSLETMKTQQQKLGRLVEKIDSSSLIATEQDSENGNVYWGTSNKIEKKCGLFAITITAGVLNSNAQGSLGGVVFPIVGIMNNKKQVGSFQIGSCYDNIPEYGDCSKDWTIELSIFLSSNISSSDEEPTIALVHRSEEIRRVHNE